jgi:flagellar motor protein MotB
MNFHRVAAPFISITALSLLSFSCVTERAYRDVSEEKRLVQLELQDLNSFVGELESKNELLRGELGIYMASGPIESSYTADIDQRLEELSRLADGIAGSDITLLNVEGGFGLRLDDAILFDSGSATLKPEGAELLTRMVNEISPGIYQRIWVRGHTDSDPVTKPETLARFPGGNLELSSVRAVSVAAKLIENGIPRDRLVVAGFGANEPVAKNDTAENKRKNRRVEIFVLETISGSAGK